MGLDERGSVNKVFRGIKQMARKTKMPMWGWVVFGLVVLGFVIVALGSVGPLTSGCPGSGIYCPGVGCVSGQDKCFPGAKGGPSAVFSKETFVSKKCPDGTRSDGPCLMEF